MLDVEEDLLFETGKGELLQEIRQQAQSPGGGQQKRHYHQQVHALGQDDVVHQVARDERLGKAQQRAEEDQQRAQDALAPVPRQKGLEVLQVGPCAGAALRTAKAILLGRPRQALSQVGKPGIHGTSHSTMRIGSRQKVREGCKGILVFGGQSPVASLDKVVVQRSHRIVCCQKRHVVV